MPVSKKDQLEIELAQLDLDLKKEELIKAKVDTQREKLALKQAKLDFEVDEKNMETHRRDREMSKLRKSHRSLIVNGMVTDKMAQYMRSDFLTWEFEDEVDDKPHAPVLILINSPGGYVIPGLDMFDLIMEYRAKGWEINTKVTGMAMSMAGVILQAGARREMTPRSTFMLHEVASYAEGKTSDIEDQLEFTKKLQLHCSAILAERSHLTVEEVDQLWKRRDIFMTAEQTLEKGFIDGIAE